MTELDLAVLDQRITDAQEDEIAAKTDADRPEGGPAGGRSETGPGRFLRRHKPIGIMAAVNDLAAASGAAAPNLAIRPFHLLGNGEAMTAQPVYHQGWTLDDVRWDAFEPAAVDPTMLAAVKAAALVEYNAPDYVTYLEARVPRLRRRNPGLDRALGRGGKPAWPRAGPLGRDGRSQLQAGRSLCPLPQGLYAGPFRRSRMPSSVRGSRRGEMIARCVVESGTSSYYSAIRDATEEPVLKEIAGRIAADEYRHYKLFYDTLHKQDEPDMRFWRKLWVAVGRVRESDDDELAYAYYCANVPPRRKPPSPMTASSIPAWRPGPA